MFKNILSFAILGFILTACNNSSDKKADKSDSPSHHGDHPAANTAIPSLPEIPEGARVFFINLKDGQTVSSPLKVQMGVDAMSVDTANGIIKAASGHHHILVDGPDAFTAGEVIPKDSVHIHFGNAQTETELTLSPGKHTLTLQFADALHRSYGSKLANKITVNVKK